MTRTPLTNADRLTRQLALFTLANAREWRDARDSGSFPFATAVMLNRVGLWGEMTVRYAETRFVEILDRAYRLPLA